MFTFDGAAVPYLRHRYNWTWLNERAVEVPLARRALATRPAEARVLEVVEEPTQCVVSVHFTGSVRDQAGAVPEDLDEVWHLAKPRFGDGGWVIAGIQQVGAA